MRILHLLHQYLPDYVGGTELFTQSIAQGLAKHGHQVGIFYRRSAQGVGVSARTEGAVRVWAAWDGVVTPQRRFWATFRRESSLNSAFERVLNEMRPDLIHLQHLMGLPVRLLSAIRQRDIPFVVTLHDYWWVCANAQLLTNYGAEVCDGPRAYINCARCALARAGRPALWPAVPLLLPLFVRRNRLLRRVLRLADRVIAPTEFVARWYDAHGVSGEKIEVLPHGVQIPAGIASPARPTGSPVRFAYIGGLSWQKGVHVVIEAFRGVDGNAELWIAGDERSAPDYVQTLREGADARTRFLGRLTRRTVWETLAQVDAVVIPSLWYETFSLIAHEAIAAGVPIIVSDLGALAEAVQDGVDGVCVPAGNVAAWRVALQKLVVHSERLLDFRTQLRPPVTLEEHVARLLALYAQVMTEQQRL